MDGLISCIITTYNRKNTIKRAIDSVLNQTYRNIELIIVDDASTDGTFEYVAELYGDDDRIIYIINEENTGVSEARNIAVKSARGSWIAFQDSDDEWLPEKLEKQVALIDDSDKEIGLIYCKWKVLFQDGRELEWPASHIPDWYKSGYIFFPLLHSSLVSTQTFLLKKEIFQRVGGFDPSCKAAEDWELCTRIAEQYKLILCDEVLVNVYESIVSVNKNRREILRTYCRVYQKYYSILKQSGYYNRTLKFILNLAINDETTESLMEFLPMICKSEEDMTMFEKIVNEFS